MEGLITAFFQVPVSLFATSLLLGESSSAAAWLQTFGNVAMVAIGLGFVIFVHELGHFLVAKACGVKCEKFYIGFDFFDIPLGFFTIPKSLVKFQWGETEYGIGSIPLGGYVKMLGQDDNPGNAEEETQRTKLADGQLDPRSYTAQTVPERMAIISAGVIMNIIFGFIFAAVAYRSGVREVPAVIGATTAGDPGWMLGLEPGERVLQVGRDSTPNEHLRFIKDMTLKFALSDFGQETEILVRRNSGADEWFKFIPSDRLKNSETPRPTVGLRPAQALVLDGLGEAEQPFFPAEYKQIQKGDKVIAVNDTPVKNWHHAQELWLTKAGETNAVTIERPASKEELQRNASAQPTTYKLTVPSVPVRDYGVVMQMNPIAGVQAGSPAEKAGVKAGDRLLEFEGAEIGDPLTFPQRTLAKVGSTVKLVVQRGKENPERVELEIELQRPEQSVWNSVTGNAIAVESMGIAYTVSPTVVSVRSDGPAQGKLKPGDQILSVAFKAATPATQAQEAALLGKEAQRSQKLDGATLGWPSLVAHASQIRLSDTLLQAKVQRGDEQLEVELSSVASTEAFLEDHNLPWTAFTELHVADSWLEAFQLGWREMKERMLEVVTVVSRLVLGKMGFGGLGGPLTIFRVAGAEAARGIPELLMFFAMLSANLAVMNFLPIPVLDGGHMLFLTWEAIFRKPVNESLQIKLTLVGMAMLLGLMVFVTVLDINRWF